MHKSLFFSNDDDVQNGVISTIRLQALLSNAHLVYIQIGFAITCAVLLLATKYIISFSYVISNFSFENFYHQKEE